MCITTNYGVARAWASGKQTEDRSGNGNLSHNGCGTLYSYSTPIGRIVKGAAGQDIYLITSKDYSVTTRGKHIGPAHRATNYTAFSVPFIGLPYGWNRIDSEDMAQVHAGNLADFAERIEAEEKRIARARVHKSDTSLRRLIRDRDAYKTAFGLAAT